MTRDSRFRSTRIAAFVAAACWLTFCGVAVNRAPAADALKESTSLKLVPADAAFYSTSLRLKEQFKAFIDSRAFAKIKAMPLVQLGVAQMRAQFENAQLARWMQAPENQELIELVKDMLSHEVFVYGDSTCADVLDLGVQLTNANRMGQMENLLQGKPQDPVGGLQMMLRTLDANREKLKAPRFVVGFRLTGKQPARKQLARLKTLLEMSIASVPELKALKGRLQSTVIGGNKHLALRLDGAMIPWDEFPREQFEQKPDEFKKLFEAIKKFRVTISLGVQGEYLLLGVGETADHLKALGGATSIYDRKEFAPLRKNAGKPITSISYASRQFVRKTGGSTNQAKQMIRQFEQAFQGAPVDEKLKREFQKDINRLYKQLADESDSAGAIMSFAYQSERGYETFAYDWSKNEILDASKRLTLLNHVGANPILFVVSRSVYDPAEYDVVASFLPRLFRYAEQSILANLGPVQQAKYRQVRKLAIPLLKRLDKTNREALIPSLKDGQSAFVLDARIQSRKWFPTMPPPGKPLPMLEVGIVLGVSDAELLKKACREYFAVAQKFLTGLSQQFPNEVPPLTIPAPATTNTPEGTLYSYRQLQNLGVDAQLAPTGGLSKSVAVMTTSPSQARRVLRSTSVKLPAGFHTNFDRNLASAGFFNWPALLDAATPWAEYVVRLAVNGPGGRNEEGAVPPPDNQQTKMILGQMHDVIDVLKCFRGASTITYREAGAMVSHTKTVWQDLKK